MIWNGFQADGYVLEPGTDAEAVLRQVHEQVFGTKLVEHSSTGVADSRMYGLYYGIPGICYGPAGEGAHAFDERVDLANLQRTTVAIATFIADWCGTRAV